MPHASESTKKTLGVAPEAAVMTARQSVDLHRLAGRVFTLAPI
jgi:hypothetical protein